MFDREYFSLIDFYKAGGGVTFACHLLNKLKRNFIYRVSRANRFEKNAREFGYGINFQYVTPEFIDAVKRPFVTALDYKPSQTILDKLNRNYITVVIHDPTDIEMSKGLAVPYLKQCKVITIRNTVKQWLKDAYDVESEFLYHPFYEYNNHIENNNKTEYASISRISPNKHTEIIVGANKLLKKQNLKQVQIYGHYWRIYVYHVLKVDFKTYENYKGQFPKTFESISKILKPVKAVVDMSVVKNDGGGSQYTFLEAIYHNCAIILNRKWLAVNGSDFKEGYNCLAVSNEYELFQTIKDIEDGKIDIHTLIKNSKKLMKRHTEVDWSRV